ncbi:MAG: hypothetical protein U0W24_22465 [Bacteroidales bacterium]
MKNILLNLWIFILISGLGLSCEDECKVLDLNGLKCPSKTDVWLTHEHVLVDFIGADRIEPATWNRDTIIKTMIPYFEELKKNKVTYFVDATPAFLGRNMKILDTISKITGIKIITNTGFYGARNDKYIPQFAKELSASQLSEIWIKEFEEGIDGTSIKPGFIKIGIDADDTLSEMHQKLVKAAALTSKKTGLVIASHTGIAKGLWPQLKILEESGVSLSSFIWVHAQAEENTAEYIKAAKKGCWISFDGMGWEMEKHIEKILFAKENGILNHILISHDAGWFDPQKKVQDIKPYTAIFEKLYPALKAKGFTDNEWKMLVTDNPAKAFSIKSGN